MFGMFYAHDNTVIWLDHLIMNIICHFWPYFKCWLVKDNLKSERNMKYTKLRKERYSNRKTIVKTRQQACSDLEIIDYKPLFLFSLNTKTNLWIKFSFIYIENFAVSIFQNYRKFRYIKIFGTIWIFKTNLRKFQKTCIPVIYAISSYWVARSEWKRLDKKKEKKKMQSVSSTWKRGITNSVLSSGGNR